jgi:hypothetical protein
MPSAPSMAIVPGLRLPSNGAAVNTTLRFGASYRSSIPMYGNTNTNSNSGHMAWRTQSRPPHLFFASD